VKRKFVIYKSSNIFENRCFCFDEEVAPYILSLMEDEKFQAKIDYIVNRILNQRFIYYDDYKKVDDDISEMRIFPNGINARIYCKEIKTLNKCYYIIAAKYLPKKTSRKINKQIKQFIAPIKSYNYEV
jgi:putative component of toxin-antitoxin plasmid stabilization module